MVMCYSYTVKEGEGERRVDLGVKYLLAWPKVHSLPNRTKLLIQLPVNFQQYHAANQLGKWFGINNYAYRFKNAPIWYTYHMFALGIFA